MASSSMTFASCSIIPELPMDVIELILLELPVVSLLRFRCVSKSWLSLISTPEFSKSHLVNYNKSWERTRILVKFKNKFFDHFPLANLFSASLLHHPGVISRIDNDLDPATARIIGSRNGLICICFHVSNTNKQLFLWNPSTRQHKNISDFGVPLSHMRDCAFGFDFDDSVNDFKVLGMFHCPRSVILKIYSLGTHQWKEISWKPYDKVIGAHYLRYHDDQPAPFGNGKFYWVQYIGPNHTCVCYLEAEKDEMHETIAIPENEYEYRHCLQWMVALCERNRVHILTVCKYRTNVWILKEDAGKKEQSWTRLHTIHNVNLVFERSSFFVLNNGEIVLVNMQKFMMYRPKDGSVRLCTSPVGVAACCTYVESLISI